jgi:hypothetical protein
LGNLTRGSIQGREVRIAVLELGNANTKKDDLCILRRFTQIASKRERMRRAAPTKQFLQMSLIEGKTAFFEQTYPFRVAVDASHMTPDGC